MMEKMKLNIKLITKRYILIFFVLMLLYCSLNVPGPIGEWDDYSLPVASIMHRHLSVSDRDVALYKEIYPDWAEYIERYSLSGYTTRNGGQMTWYFPVYAAACIPLTLLLQFMKLPAIYAFSFTNLILLIAALIVVYKFLRIGDLRKLALIVLLSANPIVFYLGWISGEVFMYSFIIMGLTFWYNQWYKRAALCISIAGMLNPVIMAIGIIMILEYLFCRCVPKLRADKTRIKEELSELVKYGCCYILGVIPLAYNYYNTRHINLTASYSYFTHGKQSVFERFLSYLFDLNYGLLPYFTVILILSFVLLILAIIKKHFTYLKWIITFTSVALLYSVMTNINCGMSGISRYNAWASAILIFAVVLYCSDLVDPRGMQRVVKPALLAGCILTSVTVFCYGPFNANQTFYTDFTPIAEWVLDTCPQLYNPLHSTFNSRTSHEDGGYRFETPVVYTNEDGNVKKMLAADKDAGSILANYYDESDDNVWLGNQLNSITGSESYISVPRGHKITYCPLYELGSEIWFYTENYNADRYVTSGLSSQEEDFSWTDGNEMTMSLRIPGQAGNQLHANLQLAAVYGNFQPFRVLLNDTPVFEGTADPEHLNLAFDLICPDNEMLTIRYELPAAASPVESGKSNDIRALGLAIKKITIDGRGSKSND